MYESLAEVHVSGHAYQEELKTIHTILKPKFFIPCHGEYRHLRAHYNLARDLGMPERNMLIPDLGDSILITRNMIKKDGTVPAGIKLVDGFEITDAGGVVQRDRTQLAEEGLCVVTLTVNTNTYSITSKPSIISRGFVYVKDNSELMLEAEDLLLNLIANTNFKTQDWNVLRNNIRKTLTTHFYKKLKRRPMILPIIIETK